MKEVVIVSACRTAIGTFGGTLKGLHVVNLASAVMKEAIKRSGIDPAIIDDVRFGSMYEHHTSMNVARVASLQAGVPSTTNAVTINRVCVSGMESVISGMAMIQTGLAEVILAGGAEHMSGVPYAVPGARWGCRLQNNTLDDMLIEGLMCGARLNTCPDEGPLAGASPYDMFIGKPYIMGHTAEFLAQMYNISREEMDEVALRSHNNVERATIEGDFAEEIVPLDVPVKKGKPPILFDKDEHYRPGLTMDALRKLPPAFIPKVGKVTAGNASGLNDGASAMIVMSAVKAKELGLKPIARIRGAGYGGCHPTIMGLSPAPAVRDLMKRSGFSLEDFELIELNEAFAAQYLGCEKELGINREICNVNGSGIGLGHPIGATGNRIMVTLMHAMKKRGKTLGLATLCGGGGVSMATAIEML
ncbi:MAG TPA: thiolase family protein [Deltaproteobacteria bacterium]|nr:thiolase family protein [Deltaproteobacteria bacterium]